MLPRTLSSPLSSRLLSQLSGTPAAAAASLPRQPPHAASRSQHAPILPLAALAKQQQRSSSSSRRAICNFSERGTSSSSMLRRSAPPTGSVAPPKLRIAVDVDEVLGRFLFALNQFCKERYNMHYNISDFHVYEFAKIWMCDQDQSNKIVHEFFDSQHFQDGIPVIPGSFETLQRLGSNKEFDLVVVTSRQHVIQEQTLSWIDKHFPGVFQEVYFGNHWSLEGTSRKKSDICHAIGAAALIDDNPGYAIECANAGIHVLLYDWQKLYPWSKLSQGFQHPLITVVHDWQEVEEELHRLKPALLSSPRALQQDP